MAIKISGMGGTLDWTSLDTATEKATAALNLFIGLSVLVAIIVIVVSAYTLITSSGNPDNVSKGQKGIVAAVVGLIIVFLARLIVLTIINLAEKGEL